MDKKDNDEQRTQTKKLEQSRKIGRLISMAWADEDFKRRLLADTMAVLREEGVEVRPGVEVRVLEQTDEVVHLVIPKKPKPHFTEEDLLAIASGHFVATTQHCDTDCTLFGGSM